MNKIFLRQLRLFHLVFLLTLMILVSGCLAPRVSQGDVEIKVSIVVDGETKQAQIPAGSNVEAALKNAEIMLGTLDKVEPPLYTTLSDGGLVKITRVREEFENKEVTLPYKQLVIKNESIPESTKPVILVKGQPGKAEVTYRTLYDSNNSELIRSERPAVILEPAVDQVMMIGAQSPYAPLIIPGKLVYIAYGNAYFMQGSTANRVLLGTGADQDGRVPNDLDGRVLKLSRDGKWLLYTRKSTKPPEEQINTLWALNIDDPKSAPIDLKIPNIIHFADWDPTSRTPTILFSTVEPRKASPGWQANNDLYRMVVPVKGGAAVKDKIVETNTGSIYGWWGTDFIWSPNGKLAYSRPDEVGIVSLIQKKGLIPLRKNIPYASQGNWALNPGLAWSTDKNISETGKDILYVVTHEEPPSLAYPDKWPNFNLSAIAMDRDLNVEFEVSIVKNTGMFAYPSVAPKLQDSKRADQIAYLQSMYPALSETSGYRLVVMDRDGSNRRVLFPQDGSAGLEPQTPLWAPAPLAEMEGDFIVIIYRGNLYLVDIATGIAHQVTGDGLIQKIDWK